jgi:hypothetical protein
VPETERWIYGGIRAGQDGKRRHAWIDPAEQEHWFSRTGARMAVGSHYTVQVSRDGTLTLHGTPEYAGSAADQATRRALWAEHTLAQTQIEASRAERDAARRNALDEALTPLLEVAVGLRTGAQRERPGRLRHPQAPPRLEHQMTTEGRQKRSQVNAHARPSRDERHV